jgi:hypothetical protein
MPKMTALKRGPGGKLASARSKTGDSKCSAAMSAKVNARHGNPVAMALDVANKILGECRAKAHALRQGTLHRAAGNEAKAQALEHRATSGKPVSAKARIERAKELREQRRADIMNPTSERNLRQSAAAYDRAKRRSDEKRRATIAAKKEERSAAQRVHQQLSEKATAAPKPAVVKAAGRGTVERIARAREIKENRFAARIHDAAERTGPAERFHGDKAFIGPVYDQYRRATGSRIGELDFHRKLVESGRKGKVGLSRADLVEAMDSKLVGRSQVSIGRSGSVIPYDQARKEFGVTEFHFVRVDAQQRDKLRAAATAGRPQRAKPPARPSLREQAAAHRATKGTATERGVALRNKIYPRIAAARTASKTSRGEDKVRLIGRANRLERALERSERAESRVASLAPERRSAGLRSASIEQLKAEQSRLYGEVNRFGRMAVVRRPNVAERESLRATEDRLTKVNRIVEKATQRRKARLLSGQPTRRT